MATYLQRGQAIGDALINGTATPAQLDRLGTALAANTGQLAAYQTGTNAVKAAIYVAAFRAWVLGQIQLYESKQAVTVAGQNASNQVLTDFPEA